MIIQCPDTQEERNNVFESIYGANYPDLYLVREQHVILPILLGEAGDEVSYSTMGHVWITAGKYISKMYLRLCCRKEQERAENG